MKKKVTFKAGGNESKKWTFFDMKPIDFFASVLCWQNKTLANRLLLLIRIIKKNSNVLIGTLIKNNEIQNLLHITSLCLKQSDILSCCLIDQTSFHSWTFS